MPYEVIKYNIVDDEIEMAILYYESVSYERGLTFEIEIEKALDNLEIGAAFDFNLEDKIHRRILIEGFPYAFIYTIEGNKAIVKILFPQKDDPAKLRARLGAF